MSAIGNVCNSKEQCSSSLCDLSAGSKFYKQCVNSLCGNNVLDERETFINCQEDAFLGGTGEAGFFIKTLLPLILLLSFTILLLNQTKAKELWKSFKKWF